jgi:hypothetical protein
MFAQQQLPQCSSKPNIPLLTFCLPCNGQGPSATAVVMFLSSKFEIKIANTASNKHGPANFSSSPCLPGSCPVQGRDSRSVSVRKRYMGVTGPWDPRPDALPPLLCCILTCTRLPLYPHDGRLGKPESDAHHNGPFPGHESWPACTSTRISPSKESSKFFKMMPSGHGTAPESCLRVRPLLKLLRKNSAQKTIHKMLDNDPRYLRPESREEMNQRIESLSASSIRRITRRSRGGSSRPQSRSIKRETLEVLTLPPTNSTLVY